MPEDPDDFDNLPAEAPQPDPGAEWAYGPVIVTTLDDPQAVLAGEGMARLLDASKYGDAFELWDTLLGRVIRSTTSDALPSNPDPLDVEVRAALFDRTLESTRAFVFVPDPNPDP